MKTFITILLLIFYIFFNSILSIANWQYCGNYSSNIVQMIAKDSVLIAGTYGNGVYITPNGLDWTYSNSGMTNGEIISFTSINNYIFAGSESGGVYRSSDNGYNWTPVNSGISNLTIHCLSSSGGNLYAATSNGVNLSTDNGNSWIKISGSTVGTIIYSVVAYSNKIIATSVNGAFISSDGGASWNNISSGLSGYIYCLSYFDNAVYAGSSTSGVFKSTNDGLNWLPVGTGLPYNKAVRTISYSDGKIFSALYNSGGIYYLQPSTASWIAANQGLTQLSSFTVIKFKENIFAGTTGGIFKRPSDEFTTDTTYKYLGRPRPGLTPLRFPPESLLANSTYMWHGVPAFSPDLKEIFWSRYNKALDYGQLVYIKYVNGNWTSVQYAPFGNQNVFESCPVYSYSGDTIFFTSSLTTTHIFRACRTPTGWTQPEQLNIPIPTGYSISLEFSIARNGTIYLALVNPSLSNYGDIYKSRLENGVYQTPENLGTVINSDTSDLNPYIDPNERFLIFVSNKTGGYGLHDLYISKQNLDNTWSNPINLGPTINSYFEDVFPRVTPDGQYFFFNTARSGDIGYNPYWISIQYIYNLISIGIEEQSSAIKDFALFQNYPNPFNSQTNIEFSISKKDNYKLEIFDILGKKIDEIFNKELKEGHYEVRYNAERLPSGIYFYKIQGSNFMQVKRMLLIK